MKRLRTFTKVRKEIKRIQVGVKGTLPKCLTFLRENDNYFSVSEILKNLGYSSRNPNILRTLKQAENLDYVNKIGRGNGHSPWKFKITEKGKAFADEFKSKIGERMKILEQNIINRTEFYGG